VRQDIGDDLNELRFLRNLADYEDVLYRMTNRVDEALRLSERVIRELDRL
jgi:hypothetical protein